MSGKTSCIEIGIQNKKQKRMDGKLFAVNKKKKHQCLTKVQKRYNRKS